MASLHARWPADPQLMLSEWMTPSSLQPHPGHPVSKQGEGPPLPSLLSRCDQSDQGQDTILTSQNTQGERAAFRQPWGNFRIKLFKIKLLTPEQTGHTLPRCGQGKGGLQICLGWKGCNRCLVPLSPQSSGQHSPWGWRLRAAWAGQSHRH